MVEANKIDASAVVTRWAKETAVIGIRPGSPDWFEAEPNDFPTFGPELGKTARQPINARRSRKKGVTTDLDAQSGWNTDLTQDNMEEMIPGVFLAVKARNQQNAEGHPTANDLVDVVATGYTVFAGDGASYLTNDLILAEGFATPANNGLKVVTGILVDVVQVSGLTLEASPPTGASIRIVGHQFVAGDLAITGGASDLPTLVAATKNVTELNLVPGEFIFIGGDDTGASGDAFNVAHNNGIARVFAIEGTDTIRLDKTSGGADGVTEMVTEAGGTKLVRIFTGDFTKNESQESTSFFRQTYTTERTLGKANPIANPTFIQSEYVEGAMLNELVVTIPESDKITLDLSFIGTDYQTLDGSASNEPLSDTGTKFTPTGADAFNTSSDFTRIKLSSVPPITGAGALAAPDPLFVFVTELSLTFGNSGTPNKAVSVLGAFDITPGDFTVDGSMSAYFNDVASIEAIRANNDVTFDVFVVKDFGTTPRKAGWVMDIPLVGLNTDGLEIVRNAAIKVPIEMEDGEYAPFLHSASWTEFWYLPLAADT